MRIQNLNRRKRSKQLSLSGVIDGIASDNKSGAGEILRRAGEVFSLLNARHQPRSSVSVEDARRAIIDTCIELVRAQPDMSPLLRLSSAAVTADLDAGSGERVFSAAKHAALSFVEKSTSNAQAAALHASRLVRTGASLLTHSRSSTVLNALIEAQRAAGDFSVFVTESRPLLEGRAVATTLAGKDIPVTLIADAAVSVIIHVLDLIIVGADKITPEHLVNKIGTRMIALLAREHGVPVYACCDSSKFILKDYSFGRDQSARNPDELWPDAPSGITVSNRYFEKIPLACFTGIITEEGLLSTSQVALRAGETTISAPLEQALEVFARDRTTAK